MRAPWRLGAAALLDAGESLDLFGHVAPDRMRALEALWARPHLSPRATGAGRWFDAVAALCGIRSDVSYDGQAAIELEAAAASGDHPSYDFGFGYEAETPLVVDLRPTVRAIAADLRGGVGAAVVAARFHHTLAHAIAVSCRCAREQGAPETVALSGGCFQNRRLTEAATAELEAMGFEVLLHERIPCNDGGLALGQAAIAFVPLATGAAGIVKHLDAYRDPADPASCISDEVLRGLKKPCDCPAFGTTCTPRHAARRDHGVGRRGVRRHYQTSARSRTRRRSDDDDVLCAHGDSLVLRFPDSRFPAVGATSVALGVAWAWLLVHRILHQQHVSLDLRECCTSPTVESDDLLRANTD